MTQYDYTQSRQHCAAAGLVFDQRMVDIADKEFEAGHLTQSQVNIVMRTHIDTVRWLFTPQSYSFWQRIGMAYHFLFGRMK